MSLLTIIWLFLFCTFPVNHSTLKLSNTLERIVNTVEFKALLEMLILVLNTLSILVIVWGVLLAMIDFTKTIIFPYSRNDTVYRNNVIKNQLGSYILFGLEILIAADIIESILNPTLDDMIMLASIVVIRTVISYFLTKEIESNEKNA